MDDKYLINVDDIKIDERIGETNQNQINNVDNNSNQTNNDLFDQIDDEIKKNENEFKFDRKIADDMNFIFTEGLNKRIQKLYNCIKDGIPVLLEGPTGTSKTFSSEIICRLLDREIIRLNLNSESKIQDLIGSYVGDENSWAGISLQDGPFYIAFTKGKVLLLDDINHAPPSVLQIIEEILESGVLSIEIPGRPLTVVKMHPDFRIIATYNPNKISYASLRQKLSLEFNSKFVIINFPVFTEDELLFIGKGLAGKFGYKRLEIVEDLVRFHKEWNDNYLCEKYNPIFTIRDIASAIKAFSENSSINDTIMTIYGARYVYITKSMFIKLLHDKYPRLTQDIGKFDIPNFPSCYVNNSLIQAVKAILFSLDHGHHVIINGKEGCGKTQVALWISEYYNKKIQKTNPKAKSFLCFCTEEIKVSDLVGHQSPSSKNDGTSELKKWQDGFLTTAIREGNLILLESIDEAPAAITEYLNVLLEPKYNNQQRYFPIGNPNEPNVPINESFRILATANIGKITQLSPSFLNRFDVIALENQIDDLDEDEKKQLITTILNRYCADLTLKTKDDEFDNDNLNISLEKDSVQQNENQTENNSVQPNKKQAENEISYSYSESIISLIIEKIKNETNISQISKLCNAIIKLLSVFQSNPKITEKDVVDFAFLLLHNNSQFDIPEEIQSELLKKLTKIDDPFFYEESPSLCSFMAKMTAYSIIKQPVWVFGASGASAIKAFSRMRPCKSTDKAGFRIHSFHSNTKVSHFFGSNTLIDGSIVFHDGTLTVSLKSGLVFIADDFMLSSESVMKSVALVLDSTIDKNVFIPVINQSINISPEFQFIVYQTYIGTLGHKRIPDSISQRFIYIKYPKLNQKDIQKICISIANDHLNQNIKEEDRKLAINIANYMINLNERRFIHYHQWSFRDISKLFRRIYPKNETEIFMNFTPQHHILFYTLSFFHFNDVKFVINDVRWLLKISFDLDDHSVDKYIECYNATPEIKEIENRGFFLMKGPDTGIKITPIKNLSIFENKLPSLWNAMFQIMVSDDSEPLILAGNSGFKTFLAQIFLPNAQICTINQEINFVQLLGSSNLITTYDSKIFYLDNILKITQNGNKIVQFRKKLENGQLRKDDVLSIIKAAEIKVPSCFHYALYHQLDKLFENQNKNQDNALANSTSEFRPGLILNSILQGQSLILKHLTNISPIVLKRFKELFSGQQSITLTEDYPNTFTPKEDKEFKICSGSFRVIGTCNEHTILICLEDVLSRFTVIYIPEYTKSEQEIVLKSYVQNKELLFNISDIEILSQFATSCLENKIIYFSFPQKIKVVEITSKLNKETSIENQQMNIGITLYRYLGGHIKSLKKKEMFLKQIKIYFDIPLIYQNQSDEDVGSPLIIEQRDNGMGVRSIFNGLFLKCSTVHECRNPVAYTKSFNNLLDLLHMALTVHIPLILEGPPGHGKHTAINLIANMLNIEIVQIMISQSTKVEDLFGKFIISYQQDGIRSEMVETQFINIIKSTNKQYLIILENINCSSIGLLESLVPVFNSHTTSILLPNGSVIEKGKFDIIGIFNSLQPCLSYKNKLPSSLLNESIYYTVPKPTENEIQSIILFKFLHSGLTKDDGLTFFNYYQSAKEILTSEETYSEIFTLDDIEKYLLFRNITKGFFDKSIISQMMFAYHFAFNDMTDKILKHLNLENMKFCPIFKYDNLCKNLIIKLSNNEKEKCLLFPLLKECKDPTLITKIDSLTLPQKRCLLFLACSVLSKRSCAIIGENSSGKSYLIRLFAELVGAKLNIFKMNSNSNISMLAGQLILNDEISEKDKSKFKKALADLSVDENIKEQINNVLNIDVNNPLTFNPKSLKKLLNYIQTIIPKIKNEKYFPEIENAVQVIKETMNSINRFEHKESSFIQAIRNGEWVLLDNINCAPSAIAEKISTLCGNDPELNLFEYGPGFYFSKNKNSSPQNKIHDNFHLFITYNTKLSNNFQIIDLTFIVKCMTFTLPPIDEKVENFHK